MIDRRRALLCGKKPRLPAEYQEVKWIHSNANTRLYTNVSNINANIRIDMRCQLDTGYSNNCVIGVSADTLNPINNWELLVSSNNKFNYNTGGTSYSTNFSHAGELIDIVYNDNGGIYVNNTLINQDNPVYVVNNSTIVIFGRGRNAFKCHGKLYSCKLTRISTGEVVKDYVPCYRISDDTNGVYDLISQSFTALSDWTRV